MNDMMCSHCYLHPCPYSIPPPSLGGGAAWRKGGGLEGRDLEPLHARQAQVPSHMVRYLGLCCMVEYKVSPPSHPGFLHLAPASSLKTCSGVAV